jgi:hypothetical protein
MGEEAVRRETNWSMWVGLAGISAIMGAFELATDHGHGGIITEAVQNPFNHTGISTLITQFDGGQWDPEDPDDFKKLIRLVLALGLASPVIASLVNTTKDRVEGWMRGEAPNRHPSTIIDPLMRVLRKIGLKK